VRGVSFGRFPPASGWFRRHDGRMACYRVIVAGIFVALGCACGKTAWGKPACCKPERRLKTSGRYIADGRVVFGSPARPGAPCIRLAAGPDLAARNLKAKCDGSI
jgi:hypothetical protein